MKTASKHFLSGLVGIVCAWSAAWVLSPERHLPSEKLVLLVGDWCPRSLELERQVMEDPELASRILVLTTDLEGAMPDCDRTADDVLEQAPWLRPFDRQWICRRLDHHGAVLFREHFVGLPAWLEQGAPIVPSEEHAVLGRHGLTLCRGPSLHVGDVACPRANLSRPSSLVTAGVAERGRDIGF